MVLKTTGTDFAAGVEYKGSRKLPAGSWPYSFRAAFGNGQTCDNIRVTPTALTVAAPPTPTTADRPPTDATDPQATPGRRQADAQAHPETRSEAEGHAQADREARGQGDCEANAYACTRADRHADAERGGRDGDALSLADSGRGGCSVVPARAPGPGDEPRSGGGTAPTRAAWLAGSRWPARAVPPAVGAGHGGGRRCAVPDPTPAPPVMAC